MKKQFFIQIGEYMKLTKRIRIISENITARDIYFFRKDLNSFKDLISKMRKANPNASITDCIEGYNKALEELILKTNVLRPGEIYRYIAADTLLNSRNCNSIIHEINTNIDFEDTNLFFTGNLYHDYISLIKTYYYKNFVLELRTAN